MLPIAAMAFERKVEVETKHSFHNAPKKKKAQQIVFMLQWNEEHE